LLFTALSWSRPVTIKFARVIFFARCSLGEVSPYNTLRALPLLLIISHFNQNKDVLTDVCWLGAIYEGLGSEVSSDL
ncbi:MAG: hypothetical protein BRC33_05660, partial [Cyanobacteria bacterium SW_9_44_58]